MEKLLYLVHRIPYPPNKGDKIRSFNILRALSKKYDVYLASFIDDPEDYQYQEKVQEYCKQTYIENLSPRYSKIRSTRGFIRFKPLTLDYYRSKTMQSWVSDIVNKHKISKALVFSSSVAQYVEGVEFRNIRRIIDFVDIDSDKWRQYAKSKNWPLSWVYSREARHLQQYEHQIAKEFDYSLFVTREEASHFMTTHGLDENHVGYFDNGVDTEFFSPEIMLTSPYSKYDKAIVFAGAMDYWANVDAVYWFANNIFPAIKSLIPEAVFYIVGTNPAEKVKSLTSINGVYVTGRVEDIRAYVRHACCSVAPLRIARGVQNKVLEAMSMAKYVIASPEAMEGIAICEGCEYTTASCEQDYIDAICKILGNEELTIASNSRICMQNRYSWDATLRKLLNVLS